jgi:hypothetical protein
MFIIIKYSKPVGPSPYQTNKLASIFRSELDMRLFKKSFAGRKFQK